MEGPISTPRAVSVCLLIFALALAGLGQGILSFARDMILIGIAAYAASFLVLLVLIRVTRNTRRLSKIEIHLIEWLGKTNPVFVAQVALALAAVAAVLVTTAIAQSYRPGGEEWASFCSWVVAILALTVALVLIPARPRFRDLLETLTNARVEVLLVAGLTLLAFFLREIELINIPYPLAGDEASIGLEGQRIIYGWASQMFVAGWQSEPSMSFLPWAVSMLIFGQNVFGLRILAVIVGALTVPVSYLLARSMFNKPVALMSATLLAVMSVHIHFSRIAVNNVENPFFACLVFWLIYRAVETRQVYWFAAAGLASGAAMYTFVGSRLVLILAGVYLVYMFIRDKTLWIHKPKFVIFGLTVGLIVFPLALFFWQHQDIAFARMNQVGAFQNGWMEHEAAQTGQPTWLIAANTFVRSFLIFVSTPAQHGFYNSPGPMFDGLWSLFIVLGLIFSFFGIREHRHILLQLWFWSVILFAGALIVPPPHAERFAMAFPVVAILAAWGIWNVVSLLVEILGAQSVVRYGLMTIIVIALAITSLNFYFLDYTPNNYYTDANSEVGVELGQYLATVPRESRVYFFGEPRMFYDFPSIPFLSGNLQGVDVHANDDVAQLVERGRPAIFVTIPEQRENMERVRQLYPGGTYWEVPRRTKPETLYMVYTVIP
jgi:Dolichyl-phosphate-mannose-protein mannosyltransferase